MNEHQFIWPGKGVRANCCKCGVSMSAAKLPQFRWCTGKSENRLYPGHAIPTFEKMETKS